MKMNEKISELTPAGYSCLDTIQDIVTKLGGSREICLAIASLGNSSTDEAVLEELIHRSKLLGPMRVPGNFGAEQANEKYGEAYGVDWEYAD